MEKPGRVGTPPILANAAAFHGDKLQVFISYSRRDLAKADALVAALEDEGFAVTIDRRDLPYGEAWQTELADFIRASDAVVWLVSPTSVKSKWCNWELGEVGRLTKRLVPVRIGEVAPEDLPEALGKIHLLPAEGIYEPGSHLAPLVQTLNTDRAWVKEATRLSDRAREWMARERNDGLLLRGPALASAERWSARRPIATPPPAGETLELILASRRGATRRQRWAIGGAADGNAVTGAHLALAALPDQLESIERPPLPEAEQRLYRSLLEQRERFVFEQPGVLSPIAAWVSNDGKRLTMMSEENTLHTIDVGTGHKLTSAQGREATVENVLARSAGGKQLVVRGWLGRELDHKAAMLWDLEAGRELAVILASNWNINDVAFSADGHLVAAASSTEGVAIANASDGRRLALLDTREFQRTALGIESVALSPDGRFLAAGGFKLIRLWD